MSLRFFITFSFSKFVIRRGGRPSDDIPSNLPRAPSIRRKRFRLSIRKKLAAGSKQYTPAGGGYDARAIRGAAGALGVSPGVTDSPALNKGGSGGRSPLEP